MITCLSGKNTFLMQQEKHRIVKDFVEAFGDLGLEQFDAAQSEPQTIYNALTNLPFLVQKKLVVIDQPSVNSQLTEKLSDWLVDSNPAIDVLVIEPTPDKRTLWYKFLKSNTNYIELLPLDERSVISWVQKYAIDQNLKIEPAAVNRLTELVGIDQQTLSQEIIKLGLTNKVITKQIVEELVEPLPQETVFSMLDALVAGQLARANELLKQLTHGGVDAAEILAMVGWQLHMLCIVKAARGDVMASGINPYVVRKNSSLANRLTRQQLVSMVDETWNTEVAIKRGGAESQLAVSVLLSKISQYVKKTAS